MGRENGGSRLRRALAAPAVGSVVASVASVVLGLAIGFVILLVCDAAQAWPALVTIVTGGFGLTGAAKGLGRMCYYAMPLIMCGLSVGVAFRSGVLNIGASGQYVVGALAAVVTAIAGDPVFGRNTWAVAVLAGAAAGGLWGLIPGVLNAYKNVNIIISGIMMTYIGTYLVDFIIKRTPFLYESSYSRTRAIPAETQLPKWGMDRLFPGSSANCGFIVAVAVGLLVHLLINRTIAGYELRTCGLNRDAAKYSGINDKGAIISSMAISGALAGIGGALVYLSNSGTRINVSDAISGEGFIGIAVALLGNLNPLGIVLAGFFVAFINVSGFNLQVFGFSSEIINVILAAIIFSCAVAERLKGAVRSLAGRVSGPRAGKGA